MKKLMSATLIFVLFCTLLGTFALPAAAATSGRTGKCTWSLDGTVLIISGNGAMEDYWGYSPWGRSITEIKIEPGVTTIGDRAFDGCTKLTSVTIPDSVTSIGWNAFSGCSGLTSVTIPDSVTSIGEDTFKGCTSLTSVTIPDSVTSIGEDTFWKCTGLTTVTIGNSVTSISDGAFSGCTGLTSVNIGNGVTTIGRYAFYGCTGLTSITIPDSVTTIGTSAFSGCTSLTSITIPDSVTSIGFDAFSDCTGMTTVAIGNGVTTIGGGAFTKCPNLSKVHITDLEVWCKISFDYGSNPLSNGATLYLNNSPVTDLVIPNSITAINNYAFNSCTSLATVTISDCVTTIGYEAFRDCTGLTAVTIPDSVTTIVEGAFSGCTNCRKVIITDLEPWYKIKFNGWGSNPMTNGATLYLNNSPVTDLVIPNSITAINDYAFDSCTSLTSITIPDSVTSIGNGAFRNCIGLTAVTIPDSVATIDSGVFRDCTSLTSITIPDSVTYIGSSAFSDTAYYNDASNWNDGILYINNHLIKARDSLTGDYSVKPGVRTIAGSAFSGCTELTSITIPDSVTSIGNYAFWECTGLTSVTIPDSVTSIGEDTFKGCTSLTSVTIPDSVTSIGEDTFWKCTGLTSVTIPDSVTTIGRYAFYGCTELTSVIIPDSVTSIEYGAFEDTAYYNNASNWDNGVLYINNHLIDAKESLTGAYSVKPGVRTIAGSAFSGCTGLTSVSIPNSVASIGDSAFEVCTGLTDVYYNGTEEEWKQISIEFDNDALLQATIHFAGLHTKHIYNSACDPDCNVCGEIRTVTHTYNNACDPDCNVCGEIRTVTHTYNNACDPDCNVCRATRAITHTYANACDTACDICGVTRAITHSFGEYVYNNDATLEKDGTRTRKCTVCGYSETVTAPGTKIVLANPFKDVKTNVYYEKPVLWAVEKGITKGTSTTSFSPDKTCSRGEIVTFLWRANGCPEPQTTLNPFTDVPANAYYSKAVLWAVEKGITSGTAADKFSPNGKCTREQIVTFLWRSQGKPVMGSANPFKDVKSGTYYHNAVLWAVNEQITNGTSPTTFAPKADCTRGQIVTFLYRTLS